MSFLDWLLELQRDVQTLDRHVEPVDTIEYEYEKIIAEQQAKEATDCSRCKHSGAFHTGSQCALCDTRCEFRVDKAYRTNAPSEEPVKPYTQPYMSEKEFRIDRAPRTSESNAEPVESPYAHTDMSEKEFQEQVVLLAEKHHWQVAHTFSRKVKGWPDLVLVRRSAMVCLELKAERGQPSPEQDDWIHTLSGVDGVVARVVKPSDWEEISRMLKPLAGHRDSELPPIRKKGQRLQI